jgi:thiol:disulfide interchange protein DsbD
MDAERPGSPARRRALTLVLAAVAQAASAAPEFLDTRQAFRLSARMEGRDAVIRFRIAPGYYLYRDKLRITVEPAGAAAAPASLPRGGIRKDEFFGRVEVYHDDVALRLPLRPDAARGRLRIRVRSQGCAEAGVCYPPREDILEVQGGAIIAPAEPERRARESLLDQLGGSAPTKDNPETLK